MSILKKLISMIRGGFLHILTGNILNKAIAMISGIVIARLVDKIEYANISYADNIYSYIALFSGLGLSNAILKFCAVQNDKENEKAFLHYSFKVGSAFEITASLAACIIMMVAPIPYPRARIYMWALILYPAFTHLNTSLICYMRTQLENKRYAKNGLLNSAATCVFSVILVIALGTSGIVIARYAAIIVTLIYAWGYYKKTLKGVKTVSLSTEQKKAFRSMGISLMIANLFSSIMPINETFLVNNIIKDEIMTANFKVAGQFPQLLFLFSGAVTVYFFPVIAKMTDYGQIKKMVIKIGVFNGLFIAFVTAVGMLLTPFAMQILYDGKYNDAISISYILWIMRAVNSCFRVVPLNMLAAIGETKFNAACSVVSCIIQTVLDYIFIVSFGIQGVAYGTILVYIASSVAYWAYFIKICNKKSRLA